MKIIDTHTHIYTSDFDEDRDQTIRRAKDIGILKLLLPNIDFKSIPSLYQVVDKYPDICIPMMGIHPTSIDHTYKEQLERIKSELDRNRNLFCAVGEIGVDLYWDKTYKIEQVYAFEEQLKWSIDLSLPVSIHTRNATSDVLNSIRKIGANKLRGVFHSFVGDVDELKEILNLKNFAIGINGVVTYKNSSLRKVLKDTTLEHIVIETDAPYLTPTPFRGKRNEPSYTQYIIKELSSIFEVSEEKVSEQTSENAISIFNL